MRILLQWSVFIWLLDVIFFFRRVRNLFLNKTNRSKKFDDFSIFFYWRNFSFSLENLQRTIPLKRKEKSRRTTFGPRKKKEKNVENHRDEIKKRSTRREKLFSLRRGVGHAGFSRLTVEIVFRFCWIDENRIEKLWSLMVDGILFDFFRFSASIKKNERENQNEKENRR